MEKYMKVENTTMRRNMLKTTVFGTLAGLFVAINPVKLLSTKKDIDKKATKVKIHPLAIKRNNKGIS